MHAFKRLDVNSNVNCFLSESRATSAPTNLRSSFLSCIFMLQRSALSWSTVYCQLFDCEVASVLINICICICIWRIILRGLEKNGPLSYF